ncbi:TSC22 domain family protein 2 isoform X2 [Esox lucius]|uniref:TSC22 domain family protein 2 isoform X2 n=1 Tax=Esox lucius TaxID=8010 RepID=UPI001476E3C4|nr:TSC22 domain family protein 2 isoform X2 [Esox lucius]
MSKMPAKKKSCFQITSVTQAQVAANSATDDTESLDDPDESRTEDVSSEIFDVSRADYEPEVCERSSSEETLNHVGEQEASSVMAPPLSIPQVGQLDAMSGPSNGGFSIRKVGVAGSPSVSQQTPGTGLPGSLPPITQSGLLQQPTTTASVGDINVLVSVSQPAVATATPTSTTSTTSCSSRFRVIKLDHSTGEPFRKGRWTCTEFYERDSEGNSVVTRTTENIRPAHTFDPSADRDSGLGFTGGSVVTPAALSGQGLDFTADALDPLEQQQLLPPIYSAFPLHVGTATPSTFPTHKPMVAPAQQPLRGSVLPNAHLLPVGLNSLPQSGLHKQKSPGLPQAAQTQPLAYPTQQQLPLGHHLPNHPPGLAQNQTDYYQQQPPGMGAVVVSAGQTLPVAGLYPCQGSAPVMTPATGAPVPGEVGGACPLPVTHPAPDLTVGGLGGVAVSVLLGGGSALQQSSGQYAPQPPGLHAVPPSAQNVPTTVMAVPTTVPSASSMAAPTAMPNPAASMLPGQPGPAARNGGGQQVLPVTGFGHAEEGAGKPEGLAPAQSPAVPEKNLKVPETLQLANNPSVSSLFGIPIPVDGDEDRNPSMAFYQALQSGSRLRDSKIHSDSASGASVVAIDNKIEQAMDLVKSHLMYAVREEVEVLKEQIKELFERNSMLERENAVLKSLANSDQLSQLSVRPAATNPSSGTPPQQGAGQGQLQLQAPQPAQPLPQPQPQVQPQPQPQVQPQPQPQVQTQLDTSLPQPLKPPQPNVNSV